VTVLFDTNILLDALLDRDHGDVAVYLLDQARTGLIDGVVTPTVLTNTFYVGRSTVGAADARSFIRSALSFLDVASISHAGAMRAVRRYTDFEDGVIAEAAAEVGADVICTRNPGDFDPARPAVLTSAEVARLLRS
jgi:predicted nucleic acid-binding protein